VMSGGEGGSGASDHSHATLGGKEKQKKKAAEGATAAGVNRRRGK